MSKRPQRTPEKPATIAETGRTPRDSAPPAVDRRPAEPVDDAHRDAVVEGIEEVRRGSFAMDEAIEALYRRAGL